MKIREIEIKDFRKLRHARVTNLGDGANVIAGENEVGKSTLLSALQAALFQRHNVTGKVLTGMQPYGCSVRPQVSISFELEDGLYQLNKTFGGSGAAELVCPDGRRFGNQDADHKLEQLLRFQAASRGATDFSTLGIWPLFWIEQGTTFQGLNINPDVRSTVQSSLTKEVGDVLIGEGGDRVRRKVEQVYTTYFTKTGQETGALALARRSVTTLEGKLNAAREELTAFSADVERLESAITRRSALIKPELRAQLKKDLTDSQRAASVLAELDSEIREAAHELQNASAGRVIAERNYAQRSETVSAVATVEQSLKSLREACVSLELEVEREAGQTRTAEETLVQANETVDQMRQAVKSAEEVLRYVRISAQARATEQTLDRAKGFVAQLAEIDSELSDCRVTEKDLDTLRVIERAVIESRAFVDAAATKVDFAFGDAGAIRVNGTPLGDRTNILASEPVEIRLTDGRITVTPGGNEIVDRKRALERQEKLLSQRLADLGVENSASAVVLTNRRRQAESEQQKLTAVLAELAPSGVDVLESQWRGLKHELDAVHERSAFGETPTLTEAESLVGTAKLMVSRAEAAANESQATLDANRRRETSVRLTLTAKKGELTAGNRQLENLTTQLVVARTSSGDQCLYDALQMARTYEEDRVQAIAKLNENRDTCDPPATTARLKSAAGAIQRLNEQIVSVNQEISGLQGRLEGLGEKGLGEACASLEADLGMAKLRLRAIDDEANAIRVLHGTLQSAESDANRVFLEPVIRRVQPYLNRVLPGARVQLSTDLTLEGLRRNGTLEPFFALSVGVREQISVITRVAFADMLADEGVHAPIILDDALVYADEQRFSDTLTTLAVAASRHQIIILTCHEDRYIRLGCPVGRIECMDSRPSKELALSRN